MKDKICPKCSGNGYVKFSIEEGRVSNVLQCDLCNSEGEVHDNHIELKSLQREHNGSN